MLFKRDELQKVLTF